MLIRDLLKSSNSEDTEMLFDYLSGHVTVTITLTITIRVENFNPIIFDLIIPETANCKVLDNHVIQSLTIRIFGMIISPLKIIRLRITTLVVTAIQVTAP